MKKKRESIYIIPTKFGFIYAFGILITLLAGAIYSNNLVYSLSFFLVALFIISMHQTHQNMKGLFFDKIKLNIACEQSKGRGVIWIKSNNKENHFLINIQIPEIDKNFIFSSDQIYANTLTPIYFNYPSKDIGLHKIKKVKISTIFPFGLFYSWKKFNIESTFTTYPQPIGTSQLPKNFLIGDNSTHIKGQSGEDFSQHRKYTIGESYKNIDWKAYARERPLLIKELNDGQKESYIITDNPLEKDIHQLRQISKWIHHCSEQKMSFALELGSQIIPFGFGDAHKEKCLKALVTCGVKDAS